MSKEMSTRERMLAVYNNQMPDKFPTAIYSRFLTRGKLERQLRNEGLGLIDFYPTVTFAGPPWHNSGGFVSRIKNTEIRVEYAWDKDTLFEKRIYETPVGTIWQEKGKSIGAESEYIKKHYISDVEDYKIMTYIMENSVIKSNKTSVSERKKSMGEDGVVFGRIDRTPYQRLLIELAGPETFLIDLFTDTEIIEELFEVMIHKMRESLNMALDNDVDLIWQTENLTSDMTPPNYYEKYVLPYHNEIGKRVEESGKKYVVHCDGKINALKNLIKASGIDVIESFSLPIMAGDMDFVEAREFFQDKAVIPNFPANFSVKDEEEIRCFLREFKAVIGNIYPFMLQISEDLADGEWGRVLPIIVSEMYR